MTGPTMARNSGVAVARYCIAGAIQDTLSGPNEKVRVGTLAAPPDLPGVLLRRSGDTNLLEQAGIGTYCIYEVEWEALLVAGPYPGSDGVQDLLDRWVACISAPTALKTAAEHPEWPSQLAAPVVLDVGAEQLYELGGREFFACTVRIEAQTQFEVQQ